MSESRKDHTLYEVKEFVFARSDLISVKVLKKISGNAPARCTCHLSSMGVIVENKDFIFFGDTEEEALEKMVEKLTATDDLKAIFSQRPKK